MLDVDIHFGDFRCVVSASRGPQDQAPKRPEKLRDLLLSWHLSTNDLPFPVNDWLKSVKSYPENDHDFWQIHSIKVLFVDVGNVVDHYDCFGPLSFCIITYIN